MFRHRLDTLGPKYFTIQVFKLGIQSQIDFLPTINFYYENVLKDFQGLTGKSAIFKKKRTGFQVICKKEMAVIQQGRKDLQCTLSLFIINCKDYQNNPIPGFLHYTYTIQLYDHIGHCHYMEGSHLGMIYLETYHIQAHTLQNGNISRS